MAKSQPQQQPATPLSASSLRSHSRFFDHLVDLIPAKYYFSTDEGRVNTKYMPKKERAAVKQAFKKQYKQDKKTRLDPEQAKTTLQLQRQQAEEAAAARGTADGAAEAGSAPSEPAGGGAGPVTSARGQEGLRLQVGTAPPSQTELRQRLQQKLEAMRQQRHAEEKKAQLEKAKQFRKAGGKPAKPAAQQQQQQQQAKKRKKQADTQGDADFKRKLKEVEESNGAAPAAKKPRVADSPINLQSLAFGKVEIGTGDNKFLKKKKKLRKPSKEQLIAEAEKKRALEATAASDPTVKGKVKEAAWGSALARAKGERVLDDPSRLRRSLKKERKAKDKRQAAWKQRTGAQAEERAAKQKKRQDNLQARATGKLEKKRARREKKLLRPGFEGRKSGFIGDKLAASGGA